MEPKVRCAVYTRVSTVNHKQSTEMQHRDLNGFVSRNGWEKVSYEDQASGQKERPELERLLRDARHHKFEVVLCWKWDRVARWAGELVDILEEFEALGIKFISFTEQLDTRTPQGKLVYTVIAACAEMERASMSERVKAGMRNARAKGKQIGRKKGFHPVLDANGLTLKGKAIGRKKGSFKKINPALLDQMKTLRMATKQNPDGLSYAAIAEQLGMNTMTVYNILNRPAAQ